MTKEKLTIENIKKDMKNVLYEQMYNNADWRLSYIIPITLLAIILGILLKNVWVGLIIFLTCSYQLYRYIIETIEYSNKEKALRSMLEREDICISTEAFSHMTEDEIYEPHFGGKNGTKRIKVVYFESGASWRMPKIHKHYSWSRQTHISTKGLENISVRGNEFFVISLQEHYNISYIYPCKLFELDTSLKK